MPTLRYAPLAIILGPCILILFCILPSSRGDHSAARSTVRQIDDAPPPHQFEKYLRRQLGLTRPDHSSPSTKPIVCLAAHDELVRRGRLDRKTNDLDGSRPPVTHVARRHVHVHPAPRDLPANTSSVSMRITDRTEQPAHNKPPEVAQYAIDQAHADCFNGDPFPSASKCGSCHPGH